MAPPRKPGIAVTGMAGRTSSGVPAKRTRATIITGAPTAPSRHQTHHDRADKLSNRNQTTRPSTAATASAGASPTRRANMAPLRMPDANSAKFMAPSTATNTQNRKGGESSGADSAVAPTAKAKRPNPGRICASVVTSYLHIKYIA